MTEMRRRMEEEFGFDTGTHLLALRGVPGKVDGGRARGNREEATVAGSHAECADIAGRQDADRWAEGEGRFSCVYRALFFATLRERIRSSVPTA